MALKVRAGEHIAAIVTTAVLAQPPTGVDREGQADLTYTSVPAEHCHSLITPGTQAIEVKSIGRAFRRYEASSAIGDVHELVVQDIVSLLAEAEPVIARAAAQLRRHDAEGRHVFLVMHPLELMVADAFVNPFTIGAALPPMRLPRQVDALWMLFHPEQVVIWSAAQAAWTQVLFAPGDEDDGVGEDLTPLQQAEDVFLSSLPDGTTPSPFMYVLRSSDEGV